MTTWTVEEAVRELDPAMTEDEVRALLVACRIQPEGHRPRGRGRPAAQYPQDRVLLAHASIAAWLVCSPRPAEEPDRRVDDAPA